MSVVLTIQKAEARATLKPKSSEATWMSHRNSTSKTKYLTTMSDI